MRLTPEEHNVLANILLRIYDITTAEMTDLRMIENRLMQPDVSIEVREVVASYIETQDDFREYVARLIGFVQYLTQGDD